MQITDSLRSTHFQDYMDTQGHLVGNEDCSLKKKNTASFLHMLMTTTSLTYYRCFLSLIHTQHQFAVKIVLLYVICSTTENRLSNTPSVSGNSTPCDHLILPVSLR